MVFPITVEMEKIKADSEALAVVTKATAGDQLETQEAFYLLSKATYLELPVSMDPAKQPPGKKENISVCTSNLKLSKIESKTYYLKIICCY